MVSGIFSTSSMAASPPSTWNNIVWSSLVDLIWGQWFRFSGDDNHPLAVPSCNSFPLQGFHLQILSHESLNLPKPTPNSHGVMLHVNTYQQKGHGMRKCISHLWLDRGSGHRIRSFLSGFVPTRAVENAKPGPLQNPLQTPQSPEVFRMRRTPNTETEWNNCKWYPAPQHSKPLL